MMKIETELSEETFRFISACMAFGVLFASNEPDATRATIHIRNYYKEAVIHESLRNLLVELDNKTVEIER